VTACAVYDLLRWQQVKVSFREFFVGIFLGGLAGNVISRIVSARWRKTDA